MRLPTPSLPWSSRARGPVLRPAVVWWTGAVLAALLVTLALVAVPAGAVVSGEFGVQSRQHATIDPTRPLQYHEGPIVPSSVTYAIYWDPVGAYHDDWMSLIDRYLHDVGADSGLLTNIFSLNGQYTQKGGLRAGYKSTFRGAYTDTQPYPANGCLEPKGQPTCLSDEQIRAELKRFIVANHLPTGIGVIYFVLTPPAVTVCTDKGGNGNCSDSTLEREEEEKDETGSPASANGICSYHSAIEPSSKSPIVYGVQPWIAGRAGHVLRPVPVKTLNPTGAVLACQNGTELVEPNQASAFPHLDSYETGLADLIINDLSIEQDDIVVDPLMNGWYQNGTRAEQSDMCQGAFNPVSAEEVPKTPETTHALNVTNETINSNHYYLQWALSSVGITSGKGIVCWQGTELTPHFTATNPVNGGDVVAFDANESAIALDANLTGLEPDEPYLAPSYKWEFGDATPPVSGTTYASVFHTYQYKGVYPVTLTVTDSGGNTASYTTDITVAGPPRPGESTAGSTSASPGGAGVSGASVGTVAKATVPGPVTTQAVLSSQLRRALHRGLPVRYSVSQQAAGHFEVLLAASIANRLGLHLPPAGGLPAGTPPQVVAAKALLITTRAGRGTLDIQFGKITAKRLGRLHHVELLLRLQVHNGGGGTTTVLSKVTLR